jgi:hypothetical protein
MIPDAMIDQAANWIADQERDPNEHLVAAPLHMRRPYYFKRALATLRRLADSLAETGHETIGMAVFCGKTPANPDDPMARVHVYSHAVFGYRPEDKDKPSFIWPPKAHRIAAKARERQSKAQV